MKRFIQLMSVVLLSGAMATASNMGANSEVSIMKNNPTTVSGYCDPYERLVGACRSTDGILEKDY
ncbi:MAG: Unknown protein [uncultured Sulfurovum sp.]|uniref:Uncharacterized protein n=1 Tax=uncultured Sulfurovum sp. TaxID=269237 RepID=A0A6S6TEF5_9BACT|nr:MAG: Unknown protein [uncultured Sulfurovum sp.]